MAVRAGGLQIGSRARDVEFENSFGVRGGWLEIMSGGRADSLAKTFSGAAASTSM